MLKNSQTICVILAALFLLAAVSGCAQNRDALQSEGPQQGDVMHGGQLYPADLYNLGLKDYQKHKLFEMFDEEEREFIRNHPSVPFVAQYYNYPISFYNATEKQWQGIVFDLLTEVSELTGLSFDLINDEYAEFAELQKKLESGEALMIARLVRSEEREDLFLWNEVSVMTDKYMLISGTEFRNININEIPYVKVGLVRDTAQAALFRSWFPEHDKIIEFSGADSAFSALSRGETDMVMSSYSQLLYLTNYRELEGYKANVVFDHACEANLGFNRNETVLCSIINKTFSFIDTAGISEDWIYKTYDYQKKLAQARQPWLAGTTGLFFCVVILGLILFEKKRRMRIHLEKLVAERTAELKEMEEEARKNSETKSRFLANISHEMRTPLNAIIGLSELVLDTDELESGTEERLEKVHTSGMTLLSIVNDILDISKVESGKFEINPVLYDMPSLINDTISLNIIRIGDKPVIFTLYADEGLPANLVGDDLRIRQIFSNLLSNAIKYTNSGKVEWRISSEREGNIVWILSSVEDSGIGIRPEDIENLFSEFNQVDTKTNRQVEGTGLGLAITKRLVDALGGTITVESEYAKGTIFRVRLPQTFVADTPIGKETAENLMSLHYTKSKRADYAKQTRADMSYAHVLVVDDIEVNLDVTKGMLKHYGISVDTATSGQEAIEMIRAEDPCYNAVFMDHMMPGMDGIEATRIIREEIGTEYARNIPVIALTANAIAGNEEMFLGKGFQAFLSKPIATMKLDSILRTWVRDKTLSDVRIDGVDLYKGLARFSGNEQSFLHVLRSYAVNTRKMIKILNEYLEAGNLQDYAIVVHGIKGSSFSICADDVGEAAGDLEAAAKAGDIDAVKKRHGMFVRMAETLINEIDLALKNADVSSGKPVRARPDPVLLKKLRSAAAALDIDKVDMLMARLESFRYEEGGKIIAWLSEQTNEMNFKEISGGEWLPD